MAETPPSPVGGSNQLSAMPPTCPGISADRRRPAWGWLYEEHRVDAHAQGRGEDRLDRPERQVADVIGDVRVDHASERKHHARHQGDAQELVDDRLAEHGSPRGTVLPARNKALNPGKEKPVAPVSSTGCAGSWRSSHVW